MELFHKIKQSSSFGNQAPKEIFNFRTYILVIVAAFAAVNFGYDMGFIGTTVALESFREALRINKLSESDQRFVSTNVVSFFQVGCVLGCLVTGPLSIILGRKWLIFYTAILFNIGSILQFVATGQTGIVLLYVGRILGGIAVGASSAVVPVYLAEVAPTEVRGSMVGIFEIGVQLGTTIGFWIIYAVKKTLPPTSVQWRFPIAFQLIPGGILMFGMLLLPESPRWLAINRSLEQAREQLCKIRQLDANHPYVVWEMDGIIEQCNKISQDDEDSKHGKVFFYFKHYSNLFKPNIRNRLMTGTILMIAFQMSGTNAINYYSPTIFKSLGFSAQNTTFLATGIYGIVRFICTLIAMILVVDRVGRRKLIIIGSCIMGFCMWYIGAYLTASPLTGSKHPPNSAYSAIVFIYVYAAAFCFSFAGIPFIYCAEIFPISVRSHATSITTAIHWAFNLMLARSVPYMIANIGASTYFVFATCLTISIPWAYFFMPETRGLSLENMEIIWAQPKLFVRADHYHNQLLDFQLENNQEESQNSQTQSINEKRKEYEAA